MRYSFDELNKMQTISSDQSCDLKIEELNFKTGYGLRVWLSRYPGDRTVTIERLKDGRWTIEETYQAEKND